MKRARRRPGLALGLPAAALAVGFVGTAIMSGRLSSAPARALIARQFDSLSPENEMKCGRRWPAKRGGVHAGAPGRPNYGAKPVVAAVEAAFRGK
jgi:hypothetical protein